jgi:hypothetical protein
MGVSAEVIPGHAPLTLRCAPHTSWRRTELYFGLSQPDGSVLTPQTWQRFVDETITPRFPDGLTVFEGHGQWRNMQGQILAEPNRVLVLIYPASQELARHADIEAIRTSYRNRFHQESVLRTDSCVAAAF